MKDGHIHSPYCPHGTKDEFDLYVKRAIEVGLSEITFTEHMPLPSNMKDPSDENDSAIKLEELPLYFNSVKKLKERYKGKIKINLGLEVDYIEGYEKETKELLDMYGHNLEDGLLSVHILNINENYYCIDYSTDMFEYIANLLGGVDKLYDKYYETMLKSIRSDLGKFKPKRISHPTLVRKYNTVFPYEYKNNELIETIMKELKQGGYEIDFNTSGLRKPYCGEKYPSGIFLEMIKKYDIPVVYGSDSHQACDVGSDFNIGE